MPISKQNKFKLSSKGKFINYSGKLKDIHSEESVLPVPIGFFVCFVKLNRICQISQVLQNTCNTERSNL